MSQGSLTVADSLPAGEPAAHTPAGTRRLLHHVRALLEHLPKGHLLPEHIWRRRHTTIVTLLWFHIAGLAAFGLATGRTPLHVLSESAVIALAAWVAGWERVGMKLRAAAASFGLITASAVLVHLSGGYVEAHFHFFVMIGVLTLYQDWTPFLLAFAYVILHHGVMGVLEPEQVYNHPDAVAHPWRWALIHGAFVLAASVAHIVAWRTNETQLLRDPLTGLPSRVLFLNRLTAALERLPRRPGSGVAVLFLDLDRFKAVNDSLGHPSGDRLIIAVAQRLRRALRRHETLARFGGDEFAILCEDITDPRDAIAVAERVLESFGPPFPLGDQESAATTASLGIAVAAHADQDAADLIRDADAAMYRAKEHGGGCHLLFDEVTRTRAVERLETENALRLALDRDEFRVFFQPEVSVETQEIIGLEALVRWDHPERGLLAPAEFIAVAEETGLIVRIGGWVLGEACRHARRWQAARPHGAPLTLRVNVSARQLAEDDLAEVVAEVLAQTGMEPALLCLEVTESVLIEDPESSAATLSALKALGVQLAVDDFGTGYSSLEYLRRFSVDCLKIDRSFIRGLPDSPQDAAIVASVVDLAHALGLSVTAEGVEKADQLAPLRARGCDSAQGYLFARPEPPEVVERLLSGRVARAPVAHAG